MLTSEGVMGLFQEVATREVLAVVPELDARQSREETMGLEEACRALLSLRLRGVRLHYRAEGCEWCDTIVNTAAGFELTHEAA